MPTPLCTQLADSDNGDHLCICTLTVDHAGVCECRICGKLW